MEVQGLALATELILELYKDLSGPSCIKPIKILDIEIYSDSLVSLSWLNSYSTKLEKMAEEVCLCVNRINHIVKLCEMHPIRFSFVSGTDNPADCITRNLSYKQLAKTNYYSGPSFLTTCKTPEHSREDIFSLIIPNPLADVGNTKFEFQGLSSNYLQLTVWRI